MQSASPHGGGVSQTRSMKVPERIQIVESALRSTASLYDQGVTPRVVRERVQRKVLVRVARGWFVDGATWAAWYPERRHLAAVIAAHRNAAGAPLFSHYSAAVLLNLPLWSFRADRVHTAQAPGNPSNETVWRHRMEVPGAQTGTVAGYRCTTPSRTLADLAGISSAETLLGCADEVLARLARQGRDIDTESWQRWLRQMETLTVSLPSRRRGLGLLRRIVALADPRAESVLESVSRLQLVRLGYEVDLQVAVKSPNGGSYFMDFELLGHRVFGECDGDVKYADPKMRSGRTPEEVVIAEKRRDNWAAGTTGHRLVHWGAQDAGTAERLGRLLQSFHVPVPRLR